MPPRRPKPTSRPKPVKPTTDIASDPKPDDEVNQQFDLELQWCIQQLEVALVGNKMNPRQAQDASRSLTVLRSKTAPMVKKRQVMRTSFGDYRTKMAEEEKKMKKAQSKATIAASSSHGASRFVKRSTAVMHEETDNSFKFNFNVEEELIPKSEKRPAATNLQFKASDNSFRFNFPDVEDVSVKSENS